MKLGAIQNNISYKSIPKTRFATNPGVDTGTDKEEAIKTANTAGQITVLALVEKGIEWFSNTCAKILMRGKEFTSGENVKKIANHMKDSKKLKVDVHFIDDSNKAILSNRFPALKSSLDVVAKGQNAFYTEMANIAVAPKTKPSLILHELGHATNFEKSASMKFLQKLRPLSLYAPSALLALNALSRKKDKKDQTFIERHAGKIAFCTALPTIIEEGVASFRGIKAAKDVLGKGAKLGALKKNYFFAWMTYLLGGVLTGVAAKLAILQQKQEQKVS